MNGENVVAKARVNAPDGWKVQFEVWFDGALIADLGTGNVSDLQVTAPDVTWPANISKWEPNAPNLFLLKGIWIDSAGNPADAMSVRTGLKQTTIKDGSLYWNNKPFEMMAGRMQGHDSPKPVEVRLKPMTKGGLTALKSMVRCYERIGWTSLMNWVSLLHSHHGVSAEPIIKVETATQPTLKNQDQRFIEAIEHRPSVALGVVEGKDSLPPVDNDPSK